MALAPLSFLHFDLPCCKEFISWWEKRGGRCQTMINCWTIIPQLVFFPHLYYNYVKIYIRYRLRAFSWDILFMRFTYLKTPEGCVAVCKCPGRRHIYLTFIRTLVISVLIFHDNVIRRLPLAEAYSWTGKWRVIHGRASKNNRPRGILSLRWTTTAICYQQSISAIIMKLRQRSIIVFYCEIWRVYVIFIYT